MPLDFREFVDQFAGCTTGQPLESLGSESRRLYDEIGNESSTRAQLATNFWNAFLGSVAWYKVTEQLHLSDAALERSRALIVPRPDRYTCELLLLDPQLDPPDPRSQIIEVTGEDILEGWHVWAQALITSGRNPLPLTAGMAAESLANGRQPFTLLAAPAPRMVPLSAPTAVLQVDDGRGNVSTAGAVVRDKTGREGVTVALHGVRGARQVQVGGQQGTVRRRDRLTDSAFVELQPAPVAGSRGAKGVLSGLAPRGSQRAEFEGNASGLIKTTIVAWDRDVPHVSAQRQACVYTPPHAQMGDSGAALVTDDGYVAGFAFERTQPPQQPDGCSWIWADSVMRALRVNI